VFADQVTAMARQALGGGPEAEVRAGLLSTHLLGVALTRYVLKLPPVVGMDDEDVIAISVEFVDRILTGPLPARAETSSPARRRRARRS
jgi:hypothetical protein